MALTDCSCVGGVCLKTIKITNGNVYLYNSSKLEFNKEYATNYIDKLLLNDYEGRLGLNNVVLEVYGNTTLRGFLKYPAYIATSGSVDLIVPPNVNLTVRSSRDGGSVNDAPLEPNIRGYGYGKSFSSFAIEYFENELHKENLEIEILSDKFCTNAGYVKSSISFKELCKKSNLICVHSIVKEDRFSPRITIKHSLEEMANSDIDGLLSLMHSFELAQDFDNYNSVNAELDYRLLNMN
jgi:hypothetical protein